MVAGMERFDAMGGASKARTLCGARGYCLFAMVVGMERVDATGGASKARMPEMNAQRLCKDAKPTKHTQTLTLRKARGIVRFGKVGGVTIPPVVARIFSGDSTSPLTRAASVMVQSKG